MCQWKFILGNKCTNLVSDVNYGGGGNSLVGQWLGLGALTAEGPGSIPGRGTKIPQATRCSQKKKKKNYGEAMHVLRQRVYGKPLYLPLNFVVNPKLL